jgi:hypothetical protein
MPQYYAVQKRGTNVSEEYTDTLFRVEVDAIHSSKNQIHWYHNYKSATQIITAMKTSNLNIQKANFIL